MKCKRLFAMILALCMVLTSVNIAFSATEIGILAQAGSDFNATEPNLKVTVLNNVATVTTSYVQKDGRDVVKIEATNVKSDTGNNLLIGFQINDRNGNAVPSFAIGTEFDYNMNFMIETADSSNPVNVTAGTQGLWIRGGIWDNSGNIPTNTGETIKYITEANGYAPNTWVNWEGKFTTTKDLADQGKAGGGVQRPYNFLFRPHLTKDCVIYIDSMNLSLTGEVEVEEEPETPSDEAEFTVEGFLPQGTTSQSGNLNYTLDNGTFEVDFSELATYSNGQNLQVNSFVRVVPKTPIDYSKDFKIKFDVTTTGLDVDTLAAGARLFNTTTGQFSSNTICKLEKSGVAANTTATVEVTKDNYVALGNASADNGVASFGIYVNVQRAADSTGTADDAILRIDNISYEYITEDTTDPEEPSNDFTVEGFLTKGTTNKEQSKLNYTLDNGTFEVKFSELTAFSNGQNLQVNSFVRVVPKTPIDYSKNFKIKFDVTTTGLDVDTLAAGARLFNTTTGQFSSNTICKLEKSGVAANTTATVEVTKDNYVALGNASADNGVASFGIYVNVQRAADSTGTADDAILRIDNISYEYITEGTTEPEEPTEPDEPTEELVYEVTGYQTKGTTEQGKSLNYTFENGTFKVTFAELKKFNNKENLEGNSFLRIVPKNAIDKTSNFKVTFDITTSGLVNSTNTPYATIKGGARLFNTVSGTSMGNTIGYLNTDIKANATTAIELTSEANFVAGGNATGNAIASMGIWLNIQGAANSEHTGNDAYIEISNVKVEYYCKHEEGTWESDGTETHSGTCSLCGEEVEALPHIWDEGVATVPATCTETGIKTFTCGCGETYTEVIPADHTWDAGVETPADCTEDGKMTYTCTVCSEIKEEAIPALGHTWDAGTVTKPATTTEAGIKVYTCETCGEKKIEAISKDTAEVVYPEQNKDDLIEPIVNLDNKEGLDYVGSAVTVTEVAEFQGRENVLKVEDMKNHNNNLVGISLVNGFTFQPGDVLEYSLDVYAEAPINPDIWLRNGTETPLVKFFENKIPANEWKTITKRVTYEEWTALGESATEGDWNNRGSFTLSLRPRTDSDAVTENDPEVTVYIDNFNVSLKGGERVTSLNVVSYDTTIAPATDSMKIAVKFDNYVLDTEEIKEACYIKDRENDESITIDVVENPKDKKSVIVVITGLTSSNEYELVLRRGGKLVEDKTIPFETPGEAVVKLTDNDISDRNISYTIANYDTKDRNICAVLLHCQGNKVLETIAVDHGNVGVGYDATHTMTSIPTLDDSDGDEYFKLFVWEVVGNKITSLAKEEIINN